MKKSPVPGETVSSFAKRTGAIGVYSSRGAEVLRDGVWFRVPLSHVLRKGETLRPVAGETSTGAVFEVSELLSALVYRRKTR